jgi:hypothetical protein
MLMYGEDWSTIETTIAIGQELYELCEVVGGILVHSQYSLDEYYDSVGYWGGLHIEDIQLKLNLNYRNGWRFQLSSINIHN